MNTKKFYFLEILSSKKNNDKPSDPILLEEDINEIIESPSEDINGIPDINSVNIDFIENQLIYLMESTDQQVIQRLVNIGKSLMKLEIQTQERISNRFDGTKYYSSNGIESFSHISDIEETIEFADEVDKLCAEGLDRRSAYSQAKYNLIYKRR